MKYVYIVSLGCPKNFVDTEVMAASLVQNDLGITPEINEADVFMINTCAFIASARNEATENIEYALDWKQEKEGRLVVVTGCLNSWDKDKTYKERFPEVDIWLGFDSIEEIGNIINSMSNNTPVKAEKGGKFYLYDESTPRLQLTLPHYAYIKISEGCNNNCSYCTIPSIRGPLQSRSIDSVVTEAKNLLNNGVNELILIAQDSASFGSDQKVEDHTLANLLRQLDDIEGDFWLRVMYMHPRSVTDEIIDAMANSKHIVPYIDLPLQHISDEILTSMNRKISKSEICTLLAKLRSKIDNISIRTTFILGYPGETEAHFEELYQFVQEQKFNRLGAFCYFPEEGTTAQTAKNQVPEEIAQERFDKLMTLQADISHDLNQELLNQPLDVIIDSVSRKYAIGRTYMDAPDIDNIIKLTLPKNRSRIKPGKIVKTKITSAFDYSLKGTIIR